LFALLLGFLICFFITAGIIVYLIPLVAIFVSFELTIYFLTIKLAEIYKTNEITLDNSGIAFSIDKPERKGKISYKDIQKISYSNRIATMAIGIFFCSLLFKVFYY